MFDSVESMVRIDMSEYVEKHQVARLIGSPPGYVGYEEGGQLTDAVRKKPYCVVLFDEIEKAHPDFFNILLQVLDDGRLTDGRGTTVNFSNTIIIMTSNLGSSYIVEASEQGDAATRQRVLGAVRERFRPEFLNRIDEMAIFHALEKQQLFGILDIQMRAINDRMRERSIEVVLTDNAKSALVERGYDPAFGARPLKRLLQREIVDQLSSKILSGDVPEDTRVTLDYEPVGGLSADLESITLGV
jgi:ATP-dependent Clp protease ATP-binding subunit ClpA